MSATSLPRGPQFLMFKKAVLNLSVLGGLSGPLLPGNPSKKMGGFAPHLFERLPGKRWPFGPPILKISGPISEKNVYGPLGTWLTARTSLHGWPHVNGLQSSSTNARLKQQCVQALSHRAKYARFEVGILEIRRREIKFELKPGEAYHE
jgi:hypothetical protein